MAIEILTINEEYLEEVIDILHNGLVSTPNVSEVTEYNLRKWIMEELEYLSCIREQRVELSHEQRVQWFISNYYETGMEPSSFTDVDFDNIEWYGEKIHVPKYKDELYG